MLNGNERLDLTRKTSGFCLCNLFSCYEAVLSASDCLQLVCCFFIYLRGSEKYTKMAIWFGKKRYERDNLFSQEMYENCDLGLATHVFWEDGYLLCLS